MEISQQPRSDTLTGPQRMRLHAMKAYAVFVCDEAQPLTLRVSAVGHFGRASTLAEIEGVHAPLIEHEAERVDAAIERMGS